MNIPLAQTRLIGAALWLGGSFLEKYYNGDFEGLASEVVGGGEMVSVFTESIYSVWSNAESTRSPLILDLDGDGVETLSKTTGVYFDHNRDGFAESTGWAGKDDGLLVRDLNGDGKITTGVELFGNNTLLKSGIKAANGFEALKELDDNGDEKITNADKDWVILKVWKDTNSNGLTDAGELLTLAQAGVRDISVTYADKGSSVAADVNGNQHQQIGNFTTTAGAVRGMNDVWFDSTNWKTVDQRTPMVLSNCPGSILSNFANRIS